MIFDILIKIFLLAIFAGVAFICCVIWLNRKQSAATKRSYEERYQYKPEFGGSSEKRGGPKSGSSDPEHNGNDSGDHHAEPAGIAHDIDLDEERDPFPF